MEKRFIHKYKASHSSRRKAIKKNTNNYKWVILERKIDGVLVGVVDSMSDEEKQNYNIPLEIDKSIDTTKFYLNGMPKVHNKKTSTI